MGVGGKLEEKQSVLRLLSSSGGERYWLTLDFVKKIQIYV